jgi:glyoxylase-like metal-dependent hydrolase (beta-lactamase superfamily II)
MIQERTPYLAYVEGDDSKGPGPKIGIIHGNRASFFVDVSCLKDHLAEAFAYLQKKNLPPLKGILLTHFHEDHVANLALVDPAVAIYCSKNTGRYLQRPFILLDHDQDLDLGGVVAQLILVPSLHAKGCLDVLVGSDLFVGDALYSRDTPTGAYYNHEIAYEMLKKYEAIPFKDAIPAHEGPLWSRDEVLSYLKKVEEDPSAVK